jgi:hypothetical protein
MSTIRVSKIDTMIYIAAGLTKAGIQFDVSIESLTWVLTIRGELCD